MRPTVAPDGGVYIHTLGCPKNDADSRSLSRMFESAGIPISPEADGSAYVVINTCGFIKDAKEESIDAILGACADVGGERVLVTGCLVERYRDDLESGIPEVAGWFGLGEEALLVGFLRDRLVTGVQRRHATIERTSYAYIKISDGCDESCTFCAIPGIKGPYYSLHPDVILREARSCLAEGARELVLVGQDTSVWSHGGMDLPALIDLLAADDRVDRIRLMYLQPDHLDESLLRYMAGQPKLCRYLDIPLQHADGKILRWMGRTGDAEQYLGLLRRAREVMPDVSTRSTFIVGFPGETEEAFDALLSFVESAGFDHAGGFVYSPEEGTAAAELTPRVSASVGRSRLSRLTDALARVAEGRHVDLIGTAVRVMIDSVDPSDLDEGAVAVGRTCGQAPEVDGATHVEGTMPQGMGVGDTVTVRVTDIMGYDLIGTYEAS